jgi:hypothetical protein
VLQTKCPIHNETNGHSFTVYPSEARWYCFGACGRGGDLTDLHAALRGLSVADAARELTGELSISEGVLANASPPRVVHSSTVYVLTDADVRRMNEASHNLVRSETLCRRICAARGWDVATVRDASLSGDLGWEGDEKSGKMLFGFSHGIKARWRDAETGKREFAWLVGGPHGQCWRQSLLTCRHTRIIITEGETDAIALISAGVEAGGSTLVVALPGASSRFDPKPFAGRNIVYYPDRDEAGAKAAERIKTLFSGVAASLRIVRWAASETKEAA